MAKPKRSPSRTKTPPALPSADALIDRALDRAWKHALNALEAARSGEADQWDAKWEAVDAILSHDPPLYLAAGLKTEKAFRERYLPGVAQSTMRDNAVVARHFDADAERTYGTATLALLIRYLSAQNGGELPAVKIDPAKTKVRVRKGRAVEEVPFPKVGFDGMRRAVRGTTPKRSTDTPVVAAVRKVLRAKSLSEIAVRERNGRVDLMGVEVSALPALGAALARVKPPTER